MTYLIIGALIGMAIFEPLDMATHTVTAAVALGLGCLFELDSIIGHVAAIHGSRWRFSLKRFVVAFVKKKKRRPWGCRGGCVGRKIMYNV